MKKIIYKSRQEKFEEQIEKDFFVLLNNVLQEYENKAYLTPEEKEKFEKDFKTFVITTAQKAEEGKFCPKTTEGALRLASEEYVKRLLKRKSTEFMVTKTERKNVDASKYYQINVSNTFNFSIEAVENAFTLKNNELRAIARKKHKQKPVVMKF